MSKCPGLHCGGCGSGGLTAGGVLAIAGAVVLAAAHRTIEHAAIDVLHFIEIAVIVIAALGLTAFVVAITVLTARIRHRSAPPAAVPAPLTVKAVVVPRNTAIGAAEHHEPRPQPAEHDYMQVRRLP